MFIVVNSLFKFFFKINVDAYLVKIII
jgi:hypothetical protein